MNTIKCWILKLISLSDVMFYRFIVTVLLTIVAFMTYGNSRDILQVRKSVEEMQGDITSLLSVRTEREALQGQVNILKESVNELKKILGVPDESSRKK